MVAQNIKVKNKELEAHFLEIDVPSVKRKLKELKALDLGEDFFKEIIFYDKALTWRDARLIEPKLLRMRKTKNGIVVSFKHRKSSRHKHQTEIEMEVSDWENAKKIFEETGLIAYRVQEKKRHSYKLGHVTIDIDTWPSIPPYIEIEGHREKDIKEAAELLGFDYKNAIFKGAGYIIETFYNLDVYKFRHFTFKKIG